MSILISRIGIIIIIMMMTM